MISFKENIPLASYSTFGIGGPAKYFTEVKTKEALKGALDFCIQNKIPYMILGKGSNCLFDDKGFNGAVILNKLDWIEQKEPGVFYAGAGTSFSLLGVHTAKNGFSGLEFAAGIPATVGGAIWMNAGANGSQTFDCLTSVEFFDDEGEFQQLEKTDLTFAYRYSSFQKKKGAIVAATFTLSPSISARKDQLKIVEYRISTQPYKDKSCGCMFKNPPEFSAGALIEQAGLKGFAIGGAKISDKHANFLINHQNGTSKEILELVAFIQRQVKEKMGIELEQEVKYIPYEPL